MVEAGETPDSQDNTPPAKFSDMVPDIEKMTDEIVNTISQNKEY